MPRLTQKQIAFLERKERAKALLKRAMRLPEDKNPEMQNVQKLISLLSQPEFGVEYNEQDAIDLVLQKRAERKSLTKKGQKKINLPVRNGPYQTRSRTRAQTVMPPPRNENLASEFRSYYGYPKTQKTSKKTYNSKVPEYLQNLSSENRMNFYKNLAEKAYTERYGKAPTQAMTALMAKLQNQGMNDDQIYNVLEKRNKSKGKTLKKNNRSILPPSFETSDYTYRGPAPSAPPMMTQQQVYLPTKTSQVLRRSSRFTQKKMTACELCEMEKQGRLSAADKESIANIGQQIQQRRNGVVGNPFV